MRILILAGLLLPGSAVFLEAATYRVAHERPYDFNTITAALGVTHPGDTVLVADGNYSVATGEKFPLIITSGVTLQNFETEKFPVILGNWNSSVITIDGLQENITLQGLTIKHGGGTIIQSIPEVPIYTAGGGIILKGTKNSVFHCRLEDNAADSGGGIWGGGAFSSIIQTVFKRNKGGDLNYFNINQLQIRDCVFIGSDYGAGIEGASREQTRTEIENCIFHENRESVWFFNLLGLIPRSLLRLGFISAVGAYGDENTIAAYVRNQGNDLNYNILHKQ